VMPPGPSRCPFSGRVRTSEGVALEWLTFHHYGAYYAPAGWHFGYERPGEFFRCGPFGCPPAETAELLDALPLICGVQELHTPAEWVQDFVITSDRVNHPLRSNCRRATNFDQPCLVNFTWYDDIQPVAPLTDDIVVPVVTIRGTVTLENGTPIQGAEVEASALIRLETEGGGSRVAGTVSNYTVTRPNGFYEIRVMPSALSEYTIRITTPLSLDLGSVTFTEVITGDTTVDARFSLTD
jgi:hypothetical protein